FFIHQRRTSRRSVAIAPRLPATKGRIADAGPADAADRRHALGVGPEVAGLAAAAPAAADRAPGIVVGRLGKARRGCAEDRDQKGEGAENLPHDWLLRGV